MNSLTCHFGVENWRKFPFVFSTWISKNFEISTKAAVFYLFLFSKVSSRLLATVFFIKNHWNRKGKLSFVIICKQMVASSYFAFLQRNTSQVSLEFLIFFWMKFLSFIKWLAKFYMECIFRKSNVKNVVVVAFSRRIWVSIQIRK